MQRLFFIAVFCFALAASVAMAGEVQDIEPNKDGFLILMVDGVKSPGKAQNIIEARALCAQLSSDKSWKLPTREQLIGLGSEPGLKGANEMKAPREPEGRFIRFLWIDADNERGKQELYKKPQTVAGYQNFPDFGHAEPVDLVLYRKVIKERLEKNEFPEEFRADVQKLYDSIQDGVTVYCVKPKKDLDKEPARSEHRAHSVEGEAKDSLSAK